MMIKSFRIIDCFGFKDSGEVNLTSKSNNKLFYIIGRNSSGKSTFLRALSAFDYSKTPSESLGFKNYKTINQEPRLSVTYEINKNDIDIDEFIEDVKENLLQGKSGINVQTIEEDERIQQFISELRNLYEDFSKKLDSEIVIDRLSNGNYIYKDGEDSCEERVPQVKKLIDQLFNQGQNGSQQFRSSNNQNFNLGFNESDIESLVMLQFPNIYYFDKEYDLTSNIPNVITKEHLDSFDEQPEAVQTLINYLGKDEISEYISTDDKEWQKEKDIEFENKINQALEKLKHKFLDIVVGYNKNGLQITFKANSGASFFYLLSENTKFLFHYLIYASHYKIDKDIILFDEPNNGFHATAQQDLLNYLKELSKQNSVIVSTHSEYLIDIDLIENIRRMTRDDKEHLSVVNDIKNSIGKAGEYLSLQPIAESMGLKYVNQLTAKDNLIIVEGLSDLYYLRAFIKIFTDDDLNNVLPGRGDASLLNIVPFIISQGLSFKIVLDKNNKSSNKKGETIADILINEYQIQEDSIFIIPPLLNDDNDSGIEDIFSKDDFKNFVLNNKVENTKKVNYEKIPNSVYINQIKSINKKTLAYNFLLDANVDNEDFEKETRDRVQELVKFLKSKSNYHSLEEY